VLKHFRVPGRLAAKLEELEISVPAVLRRASLPRDLFEQTRVLVSTSELFALWRAIDDVSSDPLIGIKLGIETRTERFHSMAIAALSTANLVAASEHLARYKKLTAPEEILVELNDEEFALGFRWLLAVDAEPWTLTDYCFSWMRSLARHGTGTQLNPLKVEYVQQRTNTRQWYCSSSEQASVYAGMQVERDRISSESPTREGVNGRLRRSKRGNDDQRHTRATARESTVRRRLFATVLRGVESFA
jgi:hypothetical protein